MDSSARLPAPPAPRGSTGIVDRRPSSSHAHAPQVGHGPSNLFGGGTSLPPGASAAGAVPEHGRDEHPNKRMRPADEDDTRASPIGGKAKGPSRSVLGCGGVDTELTRRLARAELARPNPSFPKAAPAGPPTPLPAPSSRPPSTAPAAGPPLHHPTPTPLPLPPIDAEQPQTARPPYHSQSSAEQFDPESVTRDLKKEGSDWMTMFNPNVKRVLDVGLVHTLVHDS